MNFYIGNSIEKIKYNDKNVELDDEMVEYLYSIKQAIPFTAFFKIDPYSDMVVEKEDIIDIISMCEYMLKEKVLNDYEENEDINSAICELNTLGNDALENDKKLISIGD